MEFQSLMFTHGFFWHGPSVLEVSPAKSLLTNSRWAVSPFTEECLLSGHSNTGLIGGGLQKWLSILTVLVSPYTHTLNVYINVSVIPSDGLHASYRQMTIKTKFKTHKNMKTHFMASSDSYLWHLFRTKNGKRQNWLIPSQRKTQDYTSI